MVKDLKEDDVVLVLDPKLPRGQWPLGRIIETYPGRDGYTRVAKVQCGVSSVVRPIHKLVPLQESTFAGKLDSVVNVVSVVICFFLPITLLVSSQCGEGEMEKRILRPIMCHAIQYVVIVRF